MNPRKPKIRLGAVCRVFGHKYTSEWRGDGVYVCLRCTYVLRVAR